MLQVARLAPRLLGESTDLVVDFLRSRLNLDGGFANRAGDSDVYYTVFGLEGLLALRADIPGESVARFLQSLGRGETLDFVHLSCLARCYANLPEPYRSMAPAEHILNRIEACRAADGGYNVHPDCDEGTVYAGFVAMAAYQDLRQEIPDPEKLVASLQSLRADDGGYANQSNIRLGLTPSTAAAATMLRLLGREVDPSLGSWLLERCYSEGGFYATPMAPIPDLLSTATALHALSGLKADIEPVKEICLDYVDSLWVNSGAFLGNWTDDIPDCEYTYYGLLALGHLSL